MIRTTAKQLRSIIKIREGVPSDDYGFATIIGDYRNMELEGKRVLDLGGNIGAFAVLASLEGASHVWTYEPDDGNFGLLEENIRDHPVVDPYRLAVVADDRPEVIFFRTTGASQDGHSTIAFRGRETIVVPAVRFSYLLDILRPDVVKMDIEGEEWNLLQDPLPPCVKEIVVELHFSKKAFRDQFDSVVAMFGDWQAVRAPKNTGKNFHTIGHWRRA